MDMQHPPRQSPRLLGQLVERLRYLHYSLRTEEAYVYWTKQFIRWHGLRHPREMGAPEVEAFLTHLANERHVAVSTHRQAKRSAVLVVWELVHLQAAPPVSAAQEGLPCESN